MTLLACNPDRLAALARLLDDLYDRVFLHLRLVEISQWPIPEVSEKLKNCLSKIDHQRRRVRRVLASSFFQLSNSYVPVFNQTAFNLHAIVTKNPGWWSDATHSEPTPIDHLLIGLGSNSVAAGNLIDSTGFLAPLVYGAHDTTHIRQLWMAATNPLTTAPAIAGERIIRLVRTVFDEQKWRRGIAPSWVDIHQQLRVRREIEDLLGDIVAPWQLHFTGLSATWGWDANIGVEYLRQICASEQSASAISRGLGATVFDALSHSPDDSMARRQHIDNVAFAVGASTRLIHEARVTEAQQDADNLATVLSIPNKLPLKIPWPLPMILGATTSRLADLFDDTPAVRSRSLDAMTSSRQSLAMIAFMGVWSSAVTSGRVESPTAPPDIELRLELQHTVDAIDNAAGRGQSLVEGND